MYRIRTFSISVAGGFFTRLGIGGMPFLLPLLYQLGLGYPAWQAGLVMMPQALAAITMKICSRWILATLGHRRVLISNTVLLGLNIMLFTQIGPGSPIWAILALSFSQGFFASLQFTSMNTLTFADIADKDASKASSLSSTSMQMSLSFGVATASLLAAMFLGHVDQTDATQTVPALHKAFLAMGSFTVLSSLMFWRLTPTDGDNVSNRRRSVEPAEAERAP
jgi:MFS family permease